MRSEAREIDALRRRLIRGFAGASAALLLVLALLGFTATSPGAASTVAPAFDLPLLDGGRVTNADLGGRVAVINIWASWCPPCREEAPALRRAYERFAAEPVAFLGVIRDDTAGDALEFASEWGLDYPHAEGDRAFFSDFGARGIPTTIVLDAAGRIVARHFGPISESRLSALIDDALAQGAAGAEPSTPGAS